MSLCVQYTGKIEPQYKEEFIAHCKVIASAPEIWDDNGEWSTDGWNQRGWDGLLSATRIIAEKYDTIATLDCYYDEGLDAYCTSYTCDGIHETIQEFVEYGVHEDSE